MVRLYIADVSTLDIERALTEVSDYRRQKALRCPDDEKCRCSLGAELLLYRALGAPVEYALGDNGKPYIDGGAHFSLSHSGKYAVCAVSDCEIGVDIEYPRENTARLAKRFSPQMKMSVLPQAMRPMWSSAAFGSSRKVT